MDGDRLGRTYLTRTRVEGMLLGSGGDKRSPGVAYPRTPSPQPANRAEASPVDPDRLEVNPPELRDLLEAEDPTRRDGAWDAFVSRHSGLLLHVARKVMPASEGAMDAYAHVLERLRRDDCQALKAYAPDGRSRFSTWLVVVARRMCVDFYRQKYGRLRGEPSTPQSLVEREARHRLVNFAGVEGALAQIADEQAAGPEGALRNGQLYHALDRAVATLSPDDHLLLKLRFHDELPAQRIAAILKLPSPFHVYRRLKTVCAELRRCLLSSGIDDSAP